MTSVVRVCLDSACETSRAPMRVSESSVAANQNEMMLMPKDVAGDKDCCAVGQVLGVMLGFKKKVVVGDKVDIC